MKLLTRWDKNRQVFINKESGNERPPEIDYLEVLLLTDGYFLGCEGRRAVN
jgi:hypothetical protein